MGQPCAYFSEVILWVGMLTCPGRHCMAGATEYVVQMAATGTTDVPPAFTGCHAHGSETYVPQDILICPSINSLF